MKTIVVEDSRLARKGLMRMLEEFPFIELVGDAEHPESARVLIEKTKPDLIFLDIHMPGESGFELLETLDYTPRIIFTTAYSEYAVKSFDYNTVDYLMKPISNERLAKALSKLQAAAASTDANMISQKTQEPPLTLASRIFVKDGERCRLIEVQNIRYIESCKNYVRLFFSDENIFVKKSLNIIEQRMPIDSFFRANRQYLVNLSCITEIEESIGDGYDLTMDNGQQVEVSRRSAARLKELLSL